MRIVKFPSPDELKSLLARPSFGSVEIEGRVQEILARVKAEGDSAIKELTAQIDGVEIDSLRVSQAIIDSASNKVSPSLKAAIITAKENIEKFHAAQRREDIEIETMPGVVCSQKTKPISRVGLYIPGGSAPLFSTVLMLAAPAKVAGCREIVLCTPMQKSGEISPEVLFAASICGVSEVYAIGGAMAVGAMAYGTQSIVKVDKIFGPGNRYVTIAKQMVSLFDCSIDMPAGPSEVMIVADTSADCDFVAADMLSQAEHGGDSQSIVLTTSEQLAKQVAGCVAEQLDNLDRRDITAAALDNCSIIVLPSQDDMLEVVNSYAPEHLIVSLEDSDVFAERVESAGSIFIGNYTPESAGDYASGTNHTLPTSGWAQSVSGVNLDSFTKRITYQKITPQGLRQIGSVVETMAMGEGLTAHAAAVTLRLNKIGR